MEMLGMPFVEHLEPFEGPDNYDRFREFSPSGKVPCLVEDGITIWDSLAVVERLAEIDPRVWPESIAATTNVKKDSFIYKIFTSS